MNLYEIWNNYFQDPKIFELKPINLIKVHRKKNKKFIEYCNNNNEANVNGFELCLKTQKYIWLDLDSKIEKNTGFENMKSEILNLFKAFYIDITLRGGYHILLPFEQSIEIKNETLNLGEYYILEFKSECIISPTDGYTNLNPLPTVQNLLNYSDLLLLLDSLSLICTASSQINLLKNIISEKHIQRSCSSVSQVTAYETFELDKGLYWNEVIGNFFFYFGEKSSSLLDLIEKQVEMLWKFLKSINFAIYGNHVVNFFEFFGKSGIDCDDSPYTSLCRTKLWIMWTSCFVRLACYFTKKKINEGIVSQEPFDHYQLYRQVTLKNSVGRVLDEDAAYAEYMEFYEKEQQSSSELIGPAIYFLNLILCTLATCKLNDLFVDDFFEYVRNFCTNNTSNLIHGLVKLFKVKCENKIIKFGSITSGEQNKNFNGYFNVDGSPWQSTDSANFITLIKSMFSSYPSSICDAVIKQLSYSSFDLTGKLKNWIHLIPFEDGKLNLKSLEFSRYNCADMVTNEGTLKYKFFDMNYADDDTIFDLYSDRYFEFALLVRSFFGEDIYTGTMGPYNVYAFQTFMFNLCGHLTRTKLFDSHIILLGQSGGNGKSFFVQFIKKLFGPLCAEIDCAEYFKPGEKNCQADNLGEKMLIYDDDGVYVDPQAYKKATNVACSIKRSNYKNIVRDSQFDRAGCLILTNEGIRFSKTNKSTWTIDQSLYRRMFLVRCCNNFERSVAENLPRLTDNINFENSKVIEKTIQGLFRYIIDMFRRYDISNMYKQQNDIINVPVANKRLAASVNWKLMEIIYDRYILLDEISIDEEEIRNGKNVLISDVVKNHKGEEEKVDIVKLATCLSCNHFQLDVSQDEDNRYYISGLLPKNQHCLLKQDLLKKNFPNRNLNGYILPLNSQTWSAELKKKELDKFIPKAQRYFIDKSLHENLISDIFDMWVRNPIKIYNKNLRIL